MPKFRRAMLLPSGAVVKVGGEPGAKVCSWQSEPDLSDGLALPRPYDPSQLIPRLHILTLAGSITRQVPTLTG